MTPAQTKELGRIAGLVSQAQYALTMLSEDLERKDFYNLGKAYELLTDAEVKLLVKWAQYKVEERS